MQAEHEWLLGTVPLAGFTLEKSVATLDCLPIFKLVAQRKLLGCGWVWMDVKVEVVLLLESLKMVS